MQLQKQREFAAIPLVLAIIGILFVLFAAYSVGPWAWLLVGAVGLVVCGLLAWSVARRHRHPAPRAAPGAPHGAPDAAVHHVLVIVDDTCRPEDLRVAISEHAAGRATEAFVVAPALGSRLGRWTGDQAAYDSATEHLEETLRALGEIGVDARGKVGSHDPIQAADDGLREFRADEIVLAVHSTGSAKWLEHDVLEIARDRYDLPVTPIVLDA